MFDYSQIRSAQVEITNRCQASCAMCSRNIRGGGTNERLILNDWTAEEYKKIFPQDLLAQMTRMIFCGCYGDPIINNDLLKMVEYTAMANKNLHIEINTNGSARPVNWWKKLGSVLSQHPHNIVFGLDGLEDTHHLYRIGTDYNKILYNASAFIDAGGHAEWQFILFKHNEHQVAQAESIAQNLKFKKFTLLDTYRFILSDEYDVHDKNGNTIYKLEKAKSSLNRQFKVEWVKDYKQLLNSTNISCEAKREGGIYIDAHHTLYPCCYIAGCVYNSDNHNEPLPGNNEEAKKYWRKGYTELLEQIDKCTEDAGGLQALNVLSRSLKQIFDEGKYQSAWNDQWRTGNRNHMCSAQCSTDAVWSTSMDQFVRA